MKTINARSRSDALALTKAQVIQGTEELEVFLDNPVLASEVVHFLESRDFSLRITDDDGLITVVASKNDAPQPGAPDAHQLEVKQPKTEPSETEQPEAAPSEVIEREEVQSQAPPQVSEFPYVPASPFSVLVTRRTLGSDPPGGALMKSFLASLSRLSQRPAVVALMNDAALLALYDSSSCDHLKNLEKKGTSILISGFCADHFEIAEKIGVGTLTNMTEITEALSRSGKVITL
ncbi:MAG: hypothetical protein LBC93_03320 [Synergistaceae bacterium]|nr:hypothetical protein [Synergistaceae bacterium]